MYIIDYKKQLYKKFSNKELEYFLNNQIMKKRYIAISSSKKLAKAMQFIHRKDKKILTKA